MATYQTSLSGYWQPDAEVDACPLDGTVFSLFQRRSHCRVCGKVRCYFCNQHREGPPATEYPGLNGQRICDPCWADLQQGIAPVQAMPSDGELRGSFAESPADAAGKTRRPSTALRYGGTNSVPEGLNNAGASSSSRSQRTGSAAPSSSSIASPAAANSSNNAGARSDTRGTSFLGDIATAVASAFTADNLLAKDGEGSSSDDDDEDGSASDSSSSAAGSQASRPSAADNRSTAGSQAGSTTGSVAAKQVVRNRYGSVSAPERSPALKLKPESQSDAIVGIQEDGDDDDDDVDQDGEGGDRFDPDRHRRSRSETAKDDGHRKEHQQRRRKHKKRSKGGGGGGVDDELAVLRDSAVIMLKKELTRVRRQLRSAGEISTELLHRLQRSAAANAKLAEENRRLRMENGVLTQELGQRMAFEVKKKMVAAAAVMLERADPLAEQALAAAFAIENASAGPSTREEEHGAKHVLDSLEQPSAAMVPAQQHGAFSPQEIDIQRQKLAAMKRGSQQKEALAMGKAEEEEANKNAIVPVLPAGQQGNADDDEDDDEDDEIAAALRTELDLAAPSPSSSSAPRRIGSVNARVAAIESKRLSATATTLAAASSSSSSTSSSAGALTTTANPAAQPASSPSGPSVQQAFQKALQQQQQQLQLQKQGASNGGDLFSSSFSPHLYSTMAQALVQPQTPLQQQQTALSPSSAASSAPFRVHTCSPLVELKVDATFIKLLLAPKDGNNSASSSTSSTSPAVVKAATEAASHLKLSELLGISFSPEPVELPLIPGVPQQGVGPLRTTLSSSSSSATPSSPVVAGASSVRHDTVGGLPGSQQSPESTPAGSSNSSAFLAQGVAAGLYALVVKSLATGLPAPTALVNAASSNGANILYKNSHTAAIPSIASIHNARIKDICCRRITPGMVLVAINGHSLADTPAVNVTEALAQLKVPARLTFCYSPLAVLQQQHVALQAAAVFQSSQAQALATALILLAKKAVSLQERDERKIRTVVKAYRRLEEEIKTLSEAMSDRDLALAAGEEEKAALVRRLQYLENLASLNGVAVNHGGGAGGGVGDAGTGGESTMISAAGRTQLMRAPRGSFLLNAGRSSSVNAGLTAVSALQKMQHHHQHQADSNGSRGGSSGGGGLAIGIAASGGRSNPGSTATSPNLRPKPSPLSSGASAVAGTTMTTSVSPRSSPRFTGGSSSGRSIDSSPTVDGVTGSAATNPSDSFALPASAAAAAAAGQQRQGAAAVPSSPRPPPRAGGARNILVAPSSPKIVATVAASTLGRVGDVLSAASDLRESVSRVRTDLEIKAVREKEEQQAAAQALALEEARRSGALQGGSGGSAVAFADPLYPELAPSTTVNLAAAPPPKWEAVKSANIHPLQRAKLAAIKGEMSTRGLLTAAADEPSSGSPGSGDARGGQAAAASSSSSSSSAPAVVTRVPKPSMLKRLVRGGTAGSLNGSSSGGGSYGAAKPPAVVTNGSPAAAFDPSSTTTTIGPEQKAAVEFSRAFKSDAAAAQQASKLISYLQQLAGSCEEVAAAVANVAAPFAALGLIGSGGAGGGAGVVGVGPASAGSVSGAAPGAASSSAGSASLATMSMPMNRNRSGSVAVGSPASNAGLMRSTTSTTSGLTPTASSSLSAGGGGGGGGAGGSSGLVMIHRPRQNSDGLVPPSTPLAGNRLRSTSVVSPGSAAATNTNGMGIGGGGVGGGGNGYVSTASFLSAVSSSTLAAVTTSNFDAYQAAQSWQAITGGPSPCQKCLNCDCGAFRWACAWTSALVATLASTGFSAGHHLHQHVHQHHSSGSSSNSANILSLPPGAHSGANAATLGLLAGDFGRFVSFSHNSPQTWLQLRFFLQCLMQRDSAVGYARALSSKVDTLTEENDGLSRSLKTTTAQFEALTERNNALEQTLLEYHSRLIVMAQQQQEEQQAAVAAAVSAALSEAQQQQQQQAEESYGYALRKTGSDSRNPYGGAGRNSLVPQQQSRALHREPSAFGVGMGGSNSGSSNSLSKLSPTKEGIARGDQHPLQDLPLHAPGCFRLFSPQSQQLLAAWTLFQRTLKIGLVATPASAQNYYFYQQSAEQQQQQQQQQGGGGDMAANAMATAGGLGMGMAVSAPWLTTEELDSNAPLALVAARAAPPNANANAAAVAAAGGPVAAAQRVQQQQQAAALSPQYSLQQQPQFQQQQQQFQQQQSPSLYDLQQLQQNQNQNQNQAAAVVASPYPTMGSRQPSMSVIVGRQQRGLQPSRAPSFVYPPGAAASMLLSPVPAVLPSEGGVGAGFALPTSPSTYGNLLQQQQQLQQLQQQQQPVPMPPLQTQASSGSLFALSRWQAAVTDALSMVGASVASAAAVVTGGVGGTSAAGVGVDASATSGSGSPPSNGPVGSVVGPAPTLSVPVQPLPFPPGVPTAPFQTVDVNGNPVVVVLPLPMFASPSPSIMQPSFAAMPSPPPAQPPQTGNNGAPIPTLGTSAAASGLNQVIAHPPFPKALDSLSLWQRYRALHSRAAMLQAAFQNRLAQWTKERERLEQMYDENRTQRATINKLAKLVVLLRGEAIAGRLAANEGVAAVAALLGTRIKSTTGALSGNSTGASVLLTKGLNAYYSSVLGAQSSGSASSSAASDGFLGLIVPPLPLSYFTPALSSVSGRFRTAARNAAALAAAQGSGPQAATLATLNAAASLLSISIQAKGGVNTDALEVAFKAFRSASSSTSTSVPGAASATATATAADQAASANKDAAPSLAVAAELYLRAKRKERAQAKARARASGTTGAGTGAGGKRALLDLDDNSAATAAALIGISDDGFDDLEGLDALGPGSPNAAGGNNSGALRGQGSAAAAAAAAMAVDVDALPSGLSLHPDSVLAHLLERQNKAIEAEEKRMMMLLLDESVSSAAGGASSELHGLRTASAGKAALKEKERLAAKRKAVLAAMAAKKKKKKKGGKNAANEDNEEAQEETAIDDEEFGLPLPFPEVDPLASAIASAVPGNRKSAGGGSGSSSLGIYPIDQTLLTVDVILVLESVAAASVSDENSSSNVKGPVDPSALHHLHINPLKALAASVSANTTAAAVAAAKASSSSAAASGSPGSSSGGNNAAGKAKARASLAPSSDPRKSLAPRSSGIGGIGGAAKDKNRDDGSSSGGGVAASTLRALAALEEGDGEEDDFLAPLPKSPPNASASAAAAAASSSVPKPAGPRPPARSQALSPTFPPAAASSSSSNPFASPSSSSSSSSSAAAGAGAGTATAYSPALAAATPATPAPSSKAPLPVSATPHVVSVAATNANVAAAIGVPAASPITESAPGSPTSGADGSSGGAVAGGGSGSKIGERRKSALSQGLKSVFGGLRSKSKSIGGNSKMVSSTPPDLAAAAAAASASAAAGGAGSSGAGGVTSEEDERGLYMDLEGAKKAMDPDAPSSALAGDLYKRSKTKRSIGGFSRYEFRHFTVLAGYALYFRSELDDQPQSFFQLSDVVGIKVCPRAAIPGGTPPVPDPSLVGAALVARNEDIPQDGKAWVIEIALSGGKLYQLACFSRTTRNRWHALFAGIAAINAGEA